jgi:hypothetical protein
MSGDRNRMRSRATDRMPRRWTDLVEDAVAWALIVLSLLTVLVALIVGVGAYGDTANRARADERKPTMVTATVLESVPMLAVEQPPSDVPVSWIGPDGQSRTGIVTVLAGTMAGAEISIWVDRTGARVPAPQTTKLDAVGAALLSGFGVLLAGETALGAVWVLVRRATAAANARRWEREWKTVGRSWGKR